MPQYQGKTFAFIGISGSGKGTQAKLLVDYLEKQGNQTFCVESGKLFRKLAENQSLAGEIVKDDLASGRLPAEWIASFLWEQKLVQELKNKEEVIVFDGSPRRMQEAEDMEKVLDWFGREKYHLIHLRLSQESAWKRLTARQRNDDTEKNIEKRISWFYEKVLPIVEGFRNSKKDRLIEVDGEKTIEEIHRDIVKNLELRFLKR